MLAGDIGSLCFLVSLLQTHPLLGGLKHSARRVTDGHQSGVVIRGQLVGLEDTEEILHTSRIWDPLHSDQGSWL